MHIATALKFYKTGVCPSSEALLAYNSETDSFFTESDAMTAHLADCEFCSAELHFLINVPPPETSCAQPSEVPPALRQLAEALLGNKQKEFRLREILLSGSEHLTMKSA